MAAPILALVDIDGTLLLDDGHVHGRAMIEALRDVHGVELAEDAVSRIGPLGKTDTQIAREVLESVPVAAPLIDERRDAWIGRAAEVFAASARASQLTPRPNLVQGLSDLAEAGVTLVPLTGNLRDIARLKLDLMGVGQLFDLEKGAYGDDAEQRDLLPAIALRRNGDWPSDRAWIVGDTAADLQAARAGGLRCVLFASDHLPEEIGERADAVVTDFEGLRGVLVSSNG